MSTHDFCKQAIIELERRVKELEAENERLRDALIEISGLSSSRIIASETDLRDIALEALNPEPKP